jgi:hypothetical protein
MRWLGLILGSAAVLAISWAVASFTGKWFALVLIGIVFVTMLGDAARLRKLLRKHDIDPREGVKKE